MRAFFTFLVIAVLGVFVSSPVHAEVLSVDLAQNHVDITTGFNGARLVLFGVKEQRGDLAVVIRGPKHTMVVRRKDTVLGAWMNRASMRFRDVPAYFDYALSVPEDRLATPGTLKAMGVGLNALQFEPDRRDESAEYVKNFQEALIRNKQHEGLFPVMAKDIVFLSDKFFRTSFDLPPNVPTGNYEILTYLFDNGRLVSQKTTALRVGQVGLGAKIYEFAYTNGFFYGLLCVLFAVVAGFVVNFVGRRAS